HGAEGELGVAEGGAGGQDGDPRGICSEVGVEGERGGGGAAVDPAGIEEIHAAGLHEARTDDRSRRDHAASRSVAAYGSFNTRSSRSIRALTLLSTMSRRQRSNASAKSTSSRCETALASRSLSLTRSGRSARPT